MMRSLIIEKAVIADEDVCLLDLFVCREITIENVGHLNAFTC